MKMKPATALDIAMKGDGAESSERAAFAFARVSTR
jgi:hypothetical protein